MPENCLGFGTGDAQKWQDLQEWRDSYHWDVNGVSVSMNIDFDPDTLKLTMDAKELSGVTVLRMLNTDMFGKQTGDKRFPGPFADPAASVTNVIDPRVSAPAIK